MLKLANGCRCGTISVHPKNWESAGANIKIDWYISYRFHDPLFEKRYPKGKLVLVKGMNGHKTLGDRRKATRAIRDNELDILKSLDYNPITGYLRDPEIDADIDPLAEYSIDPNAPFIPTLESIIEKLDVSRDVKKDIRSVVKYSKTAAMQLRIDQVPICKIRRKHIRVLLDQVGKVKEQIKKEDPTAPVKWTPRTYNFYRSHLMMLFRWLEKEEVIDSNPLATIDTKKVEKKKRKTLTDQEREMIDTRLREDNFDFWLVMHLFFHSGARSTEFVQIRQNDVDLEKREILYHIKKGSAREAYRPIKKAVYDIWQYLLSKCEPGRNQFVISEGMKPGDNAIRPEQLTRRWKRWVKDRYGIDADWYSLKHTNSTETVERVGKALAARMNEHSVEVLTRNYDVNSEARELEILKIVDNSFSKTKIIPLKSLAS